MIRDRRCPGLLTRHVLATGCLLFALGACDASIGPPAEEDGAVPVLDQGALPDGGGPAVDAPTDDGTLSPCGNGACEAGEDEQSCPEDCKPSVWRPKPGTTWQWQLRGPLDVSVDVTMYDIDLFDNTKETIAALQADGRVVICYFSAGSLENWRPDAATIPAAAVGEDMDGWDERWLDVRHQGVRDAMVARLELAKQKGCDGVEPDNVDGYQNDTGFDLSFADQLDFNKFLAAEAHARGLSIGLKNDLGQISQLVGHFDWALNEECYEYGECDRLTPFIDAGKAVFHCEYGSAASEVCPTTQPLGLSTLIKRLDLMAWFDACWLH